MSELEEWELGNEEIINNPEEIDYSNGDEIFLENRFGDETKHEVLWSLKTSGTHPEAGQFWNGHQIVRCKGTDQITYRETNFTQEYDLDYYPNGSYKLNEHPHLYPPRGGVSGELNGYELPEEIERVYKEVIDAINAEMLVLSTLGMRVLVEQICLKLGAAQYTLTNKLEILKYKNILSVHDYDVLICLTKFGNDAAHQAKPISKSKLLDALKVVENNLQRFVIHPEKFPKPADSSSLRLG